MKTFIIVLCFTIFPLFQWLELSREQKELVKDILAVEYFEKNSWCNKALRHQKTTPATIEIWFECVEIKI